MLRVSLIGLVLTLMVVGAGAKSVTVGTSGADFTSINAAINDVREANDPGGPDTITILDAGPFFETRVILNNIGGTTFTMQAASGVRPLVVIDTIEDGALFIRPSDAPGQTAPSVVFISDLIIIPATGTPTTRPQAAVRVQTPATPLAGWSVTLDNILVTSNDGNNRPVASLDGLSIANPPGPSAATFRDEGFLVDSSNQGFNYQLTLTRFIVAGLTGDQGSDGIRGFLDGQDSTQSFWRIGPGCVVNLVNRSGIQPGGNNNCPVYIEGSSDEPILIVNNSLDGIEITGSETDGGLRSIKWVAVVNNGRRAVTNGNGSAQPLEVENCTFVNNGASTSSIFEQWNELDTSNRVISLKGNVIFAGNGIQSATTTQNLIDVSTSGSGIFAATDSAIVLSGPYSLNRVPFDGDGFDDNTPSNVFLNNVITDNPYFASTTAGSPDFLTVRNPSYGTAGPGGTPLRGVGAYNPISLTGVGESSWSAWK